MNNNALHVIVIVLAIVLMFAPFALCTETMYEEVSTDERLYRKGVVRSVSPESYAFTFRPTNGTLLSIRVDRATVILGFTSLDDLERNNQVKVWYIPDGKINRAVMVKKLIDLGC